MQGAQPTCRARYGRVPYATCGCRAHTRKLRPAGTHRRGNPGSGRCAGWSWQTERRKGSQMAESCYKGGAMRGRLGCRVKGRQVPSDRHDRPGAVWRKSDYCWGHIFRR